MEKIDNNKCDVYISNDYKNLEMAFKELNILKDNKYIYDSILIITDDNVCDIHLRKLKKHIKFNDINEFVIKSGETSKYIDTYMEIINYCIDINLSRKSLIIGLGGGVVGDLAGFVSSTYMRGIDFIQIPTTLLSQVDSSVGGKTGINVGEYKNIIGTFYQPKLTYINIDLLKTLPNDEFKNGICEVIKYGFIYDYKIIDYMINNYNHILNNEEDYIYKIVKKSIDIKAEIVEKDEKEGSLRKILNFGHTFGHAIEKLYDISHGYSVNIGTNMAFNLSIHKEYIKKEYYDQFKLISKLYDLPITHKNINEYDVLKIMKKDKKNSFNNINLILPIEKGEVKIFNDINDEDILSAIRMCKDA